MRREATKHSWNMFDNVNTPDKLDEAKRLLHKRITLEMGVVATWQTIKLNPND